MTAPQATISLNAVRGKNVPTPPSPPSVHLELNVTDNDSTRELVAKVAGRERDEYALAALRVGLLSLKHARGQVDADAVRTESEKLLSELKTSLENYRSNMTSDVSSILKDYFDPQSGRLHERLERLVKRDGGEIEQLLRSHLGPEDSVLTAALSAHIGENSPIMNLLHPEQADGVVAAVRTSATEALNTELQKLLVEFSLDNKGGALSRMVAELEDKNGKLTGDLKIRIAEIIDEFSLDKDDSILSKLIRKVETAQSTIQKEFSLDNGGSALVRLKDELLNVLKTQTEQNSKFQTEMTAAIEAMKARRAEALRSTTHGIDFEQALYELIQTEAQRAGDIPTATGNSVGLKKRAKVGDATVELGPDSAAPGVKIVIEAKEKAGYTFTEAREEIKDARENRDAAVGLFVFSKDTAPHGTEPLSRIGNDVFVIWDSNDVNSDVVIRAALSLAKALCVHEAKRHNADVAELETISRSIIAIEAEAARLAKMKTWTETIQTSSGKVLDEIYRMQTGLEREVTNLRETVRGLRSDDDKE